MIVFLTLCYIGILAALIKFKVVPLNNLTKASPLLFSMLLMVGIFVPMQFAAPAGPVIAGRNVVQIVPLVAGQVVEVAVEAYQPLKKGDLLFRIEDRPYRAAVAAVEAQLTLAKRRFDQATELQNERAGSLYEMQAAETQVESLEAQLDAAMFNLENTSVYAPTDGHVTALALREGSMLMSAPFTQAMAFVDDSEIIVVVQIHQINIRHVAPGQDIEAIFKTRPGEVFTGTVEHVVSDLATGQLAPSGVLPMPTQIGPAPFNVRLSLDDPDIARSLQTGAAGTAAIYTGEFEISYMIRQTMMRMDAWLAYILPV
jgi:multidrug efflux pump subunit AcrA (membrane-fusion protein)